MWRTVRKNVEPCTRFAKPSVTVRLLELLARALGWCKMLSMAWLGRLRLLVRAQQISRSQCRGHPRKFAREEGRERY